MTPRELVERWRLEAMRKDAFHATMGLGWKVCADELAAALDAQDAEIRREIAVCYNCGPGPLTERRNLCSRCREVYRFNDEGAMVVKK